LHRDRDRAYIKRQASVQQRKGVVLSSKEPAIRSRKKRRRVWGRKELWAGRRGSVRREKKPFSFWGRQVIKKKKKANWYE